MGPPGAQSAELVGRHWPHGRLLAALETVLAGRGRLVLVSGEAGIGKTSLVAALAGTTGDRALMAWGTCWEGGGAPGYWPWSQALDGLVRAVGKDQATELAGDDVPLLASVAPALGVGSDTAGSGDEQARLSLFSAVERWLARISSVHPVVVVLEDLHWADRSSLLLVDFLSRAHHAVPLLIIGTYRHDELDAVARDRLAGMAARSDHLHLEGLGPADVR
ncbi:MAG TPA: AAA family ATPase, partial [Acidimicrobiales bacterium]|nr:AAA family ATPase [Acidimicrobiales bacterium]